ncbi:MAG: C/D box methylation guide ribonucleoprotein complex aNOP56 subunit [Candidatus Altiarchaeota archaeon]|nr:C/D box methylation guide ribonucleoprotein complex aNOP56 subunit [Candidatus Altiarchaeota archaeon]
MVRLVPTAFGFFAITEDDQLLDYQEISKDAKKAAETLTDKSFTEWVGMQKKKHRKVSIGYNPMRAAELIGISKEDYLSFSRKVAIELAKIKVKESMGKDQLVIQSIAGLDDLNKSINIQLNRLHEWYGMHFPEYYEDDHKKFLKTIIEKERGKSMGIDFSETDLKIVRKLAERILELYKFRDALEKYIGIIMEEVAPNVKALAGSTLGARFVERAGGLKRLAEMPASTIQVLGAEKALFKHLIKGTPPPKHGIIFQHPAINKSPKSIRGKLARTLAAKTALGARADYFSQELRPKLVEEWEKRKKEVMK